MATITPGTDSTFKTGTAEGRAIEAICYLQLQESLTENNSSGRDAIQATFDLSDNTFSGTYAIPAEQGFSANGGLTISAVPYLQNVSISPGTNAPTFKSQTLEAYVLEVLMYLQAWERNTVKNPQSRNYITGSFNSDTGIYQGTFTLPISLVLDATGKASFSAVEYLLT